MLTFTRLHFNSEDFAYSSCLSSKKHVPQQGSCSSHAHGVALPTKVTSCHFAVHFVMELSLLSLTSTCLCGEKTVRNLQVENECFQNQLPRQKDFLPCAHFRTRWCALVGPLQKLGDSERGLWFHVAGDRTELSPGIYVTGSPPWPINKNTTVSRLVTNG